MSKAQLSHRLDAAMHALKEKTDGWANLFTGMGIKGRDKRKKTEWQNETRMQDSTLQSLYRGEGFAQRIIDLPANDMTREWFYIEGDDQNLVLDKLKSLHAKVEFNRALRFARLYGGSLLIAGINDGGDLIDELNLDNIKEVEFLRVIDRSRVNPKEYYNDPNDRRYNEVKVYQISPIRGVPYDVHESRVARFDGVDVPQRIRQENQGWGDSVLQAGYARIKGLAESYCHIETIITEFIIGVLKVNGLADLIASGRENLIQKRLTQVDLSKSIINSVLIDNEEEYNRISGRVSGLDTLLDKLIQALSAVTGIPVTLLMGQAPAGLQATGASDIRFYYDMISGQQETKLQPHLEWLIKLIMLSKEKPFTGKEFDNWKIEFNPLWQPTQKEQAEIRRTQAETDEKYILSSVLSPDEVAMSRFGGRSYSLNTTLETERKPDLPKKKESDNR